ncbi:hypothetical protein CR513_56507, partial [Mucuna pruriens]
MDCSMIHAASGGALMDKTPTAVRHLISNMASNTQQFGTKGAVMNRAVNEVGIIDNLRLENQQIELTSLHQQFPQVKIYGICTSMEHPTDMCSTLQEIESNNVEIVGAIGGTQFGRQPYLSWQSDGQQFRMQQQYRSSLGQGQYVIPRFRSAPNMSAPHQNYYQQSRSRYQAPPFQQQQQQQMPA